MVVEVAPLGLPMHRRRVQASGGETMKPLLRPLFTAMGSAMISGSIGTIQAALACFLAAQLDLHFSSLSSSYSA